MSKRHASVQKGSYGQDITMTFAKLPVGFASSKAVTVNWTPDPQGTLRRR